MSSLYPEEPKKLDVITHLEELRRRILYCLLVLAAAAVASFYMGDNLMALVRAPINGLVDELIFISPTEAFVSYIKVAILAGFVIVFPFLVYQVWAFMSPALHSDTRKRVVVWLMFSLLLFFSGIAFSYYVAIPAALKFLIGFSRGIAVAKITLGKYISFFGAFILIGGIVFEIPVVIGLLTDAGMVTSSVLRQKRHIALIVILIFAAVITPTQDIMNMLIFALPMMLLFEIGILISRIIESRKK